MKRVHHRCAVNPLALGVRLALGGIAALALSGVAMAQEKDKDEAEAAKEEITTLEPLSVLGTRSAGRSATDSAVPIDILVGTEMHNQAATDMVEQMRTLIPSFNVSTIPIDDAASLVRPANLRGLPPDNALILLNGKRRHRAAVITFLGHGLSD